VEGFLKVDEEIMMGVRGQCYRFDDVQVDVQNLRVTVGEEIRPLEPKSFRLLVFLLENPGRALSKDEIMAAVWPDAFVSDNSLARAIAQIRKALDDDPKAPRYVETVPTVGYRFVGECEEQDAVAPKGNAAAAESRSRPRRWWLLWGGVGCGLLAGIGFYVAAIERKTTDAYPLRVASVAKLTSYPGDEREPAVSPDGSAVAFSWSGAAGNNYDIYVVKPGGKAPLRLTTDAAADTFPVWSPDGGQIAFVRRKGEFAEIVMVPAGGGPERVLAPVFADWRGPGFQPASGAGLESGWGVDCVQRAIRPGRKVPAVFAVGGDGGGAGVVGAGCEWSGRLIAGVFCGWAVSGVCAVFGAA
jgi:DNA-binding winged helix-turn-helix (wHTH) protein